MASVARHYNKDTSAHKHLAWPLINPTMAPATPPATPAATASAGASTSTTTTTNGSGAPLRYCDDLRAPLTTAVGPQPHAPMHQVEWRKVRVRGGSASDSGSWVAAGGRDRMWARVRPHGEPKLVTGRGWPILVCGVRRRR